LEHIDDSADLSQKVTIMKVLKGLIPRIGDDICVYSIVRKIKTVVKRAEKQNNPQLLQLARTPL
jgi:hypothetical protein